MHARTPTPLRLTPDDAPRLRILRAEALVAFPWSFGSAPGDDRFESEDFTRAHLADPINAVFAIEDGADPAKPLLAMAGLIGPTRVKQPHIAGIWGVYTSQRARRTGCARALINAAIDHARARPAVTRVYLSVSERNPGARALYESLGFITWGVEPDAIRIGNEFANECHMSLAL